MTPRQTLIRLLARHAVREHLQAQTQAPCGVWCSCTGQHAGERCQSAGMLPKYRSASCNDVARIVDSEMALRQERDALQADNARLWGALNTQLNDCINFNGGQLTICIMEASTAALAATPEQSLAAYRNKVIEECAAKCKDKHVNGNWMYDYREECEAAILDMKEQP